MNSGIALIQLVSEQAMPNLLAALALEPRLLIHLTTPKSHQVSARIAETCRRAALDLTHEDIGLSSMPSLAETRRAIGRAARRAADAGLLPVLNFTGGTKLMSIGAWEEARASAMPSLYVDTQERCFWDGETGDFSPFAAALGDFDAAARKLRVDLVAFSNGVARTTAGCNHATLIPLADHLLRDQATERQVWEAISGRSGFLAKALGGPAFSPRDANQILYLYETTVEGLPPETADLAVACGLLEEAEDGMRIASVLDGIDVVSEAHQLLSQRFERSEYRQRLNRLRNAAQLPLNFLSGAWLEVAAADAMNRSGRFHDVRWSVQVGDEEGYDLEEDVVALDGVRLAYISCKRSSRLHAHAEEIRARANRIGGIFSSCYYVIHEMPHGAAKDDLLERCRQLGGIRVIPSYKLLGPNPFDHA